MNANTFGHRLQMHTFGESHGVALGVVVDGCPAGLTLAVADIQKALDQRRPGQSAVVSQRQETDQVEILSGIFEGKTLGTPIAMIVRNQDARSEDYKDIQRNPRRGHADDVWKEKFLHSDPRGGGRSSGRETLSRVMAGAVAEKILKTLSPQTETLAYAQQIGPYQLQNSEVTRLQVEKSLARFPSAQSAEVEDFLIKSQKEGQSWGGTVEVRISHPPTWLGQPVFHKLKSDLAMACLSLGATTGFELGLGFSGLEMPGTEFHTSTQARAYAGIRGGVSTGEDIIFRVAFKPTSSILEVAKRGRHDPCIVIRACSVIEAMVYFVLADHLLWQRSDRI